MTEHEHLIQATESSEITGLVRVELHDATDADYERLHVAMWTRGFLRTVHHAPSGRRYELPPGTYAWAGDDMADDVAVAIANEAARAIGMRAQVIAAFGSVTWSGLTTHVPHGDVARKAG